MQKKPSSKIPKLQTQKPLAEQLTNSIAHITPPNPANIIPTTPSFPLLQNIHLAHMQRITKQIMNHTSSLILIQGTIITLHMLRNIYPFLTIR